MTNSNPYDKAHELARVLLDSEIYQDYVAAHKKLAQNSAALDQVQEFRKLQMKVNQADAMGQEPVEGWVSDLALQYAKLNQDELIAEYFQAEGRFVQMFTDIQQILQKSMESGFER
jgi:cell fate (sporulation/competence/biofilm development) regulator YlbF (YheA/YmcA/DUF963 family)